MSEDFENIQKLFAWSICKDKNCRCDEKIEKNKQRIIISLTTRKMSDIESEFIKNHKIEIIRNKTITTNQFPVNNK